MEGCTWSAGQSIPELMCVCCVVCCLLQDLGGYLEDSSRVPDHAHKFTTKIDRVSPQLYYGVVITEMRVGNSSVPLDCRKVGLHNTHTHTRNTHTRNLQGLSLGNHPFTQRKLVIDTCCSLPPMHTDTRKPDWLRLVCSFKAAHVRVS